MKKLLVLFTILSLTALPFRPAEARVTDVRIQRFVVLSTLAACAVNVQILNIVNNQLNGSEALLLNGVILATLAVLVASGLQNNDYVLFASPSFEAESGITADVPLTDQQCMDIQEGDELSFLGSDGVVVSQAILVISVLAVLTAIAYIASINDYEVFALATFFITINNLITSVLVGNTSGEDSEAGGGQIVNAGGCSLAQASSSKAPLWLAWLGLGGGLAFFRRRLC